MATKTISASQLKGDSIHDFSGGPNLRDARQQLTLNEQSDAWNATYDERGGASSRLGYVTDNDPATDLYGAGGTSAPGDLIVNQDWLPILDAKVVQAGADIYLDSDPTSSVHTFSTDACVTFAELNALAIACHPADGIYTSSDGATWTVVSDADAPTNPTCCAVWQNKLFVGDATGRLSWSNAGDATAWTSTDFNKIWEKDQDGLVAMHIGSGQDILGQPGLFVCKNDSSYRVNASDTGAYTTIDATVGCAGPKAITGVGAKVIVLSKHGIFEWAEGSVGMENVSDRFLPLWQPDQINMAQQAGWAAGRRGGRAYFSLTRAGSSVNDVAIEYHPGQGWLAPRSDAMSCYATSASEIMYGGSPTVAGQVYELASSGTDDGAPIVGRFQTRWFVLNDGFQASVWQVLLHGRSAATGTTVTIRTDYASGGGETRPVDLASAGGGLYDTGLNYDTGIMYVEPAYEETQQLLSIGRCREFSLLFDFSCTTTADMPQVLGAGTSPVAGEFGLYGIEWLYQPLGLS